MATVEISPIERAKAFLRAGERDPEKAFALVKELKRIQEFGYAASGPWNPFDPVSDAVPSSDPA